MKQGVTTSEDLIKVRRKSSQCRLNGSEQRSDLFANLIDGKQTKGFSSFMHNYTQNQKLISRAK